MRLNPYKAILIWHLSYKTDATMYLVWDILFMALNKLYRFYMVMSHKNDIIID